MAASGIDFVGMRSDKPDDMVRLFRDVIGIPVVRQTDNLTGFRLGDGTTLELYGTAVGFRVDDFDATRRAMVAAGIRFMGDIQHADGQSWQHFSCPDGTIAEIIGRGAWTPA